MKINRQMDTETDRWTEGQMDRRADRHRKMDRHTE